MLGNDVSRVRVRSQCGEDKFRACMENFHSPEAVYLNCSTYITFQGLVQKLQRCAFFLQTKNIEHCPVLKSVY